MSEYSALWASVGMSIVLACITAYHAFEARKIRIESIKPSFSVTIGPYPSSFDFFGGGDSRAGLFGERRKIDYKITHYGLYLINSGGRAKNIRVDLEYDTSVGKTVEKYYSPALTSGEWLSLEVSPEYVQRLKIFISYLDDYNHELTDEFSFDYSQLVEEHRELNTSSDTQIGLLVEIKTYLEKIANTNSEQVDKFTDITDEIKKLTERITALKKPQRALKK